MICLAHCMAGNALEGGCNKPSTHGSVESGSYLKVSSLLPPVSGWGSTAGKLASLIYRLPPDVECRHFFFPRSLYVTIQLLLFITFKVDCYIACHSSFCHVLDVKWLIRISTISPSILHPSSICALSITSIAMTPARLFPTCYIYLSIQQSPSLFLQLGTLGADTCGRTH